MIPSSNVVNSSIECALLQVWCMCLCVWKCEEVFDFLLIGVTWDVLYTEKQSWQVWWVQGTEIVVYEEVLLEHQFIAAKKLEDLLTSDLWITADLLEFKVRSLPILSPSVLSGQTNELGYSKGLLFPTVDGCAQEIWFSQTCNMWIWVFHQAASCSALFKKVDGSCCQLTLLFFEGHEEKSHCRWWVTIADPNGLLWKAIFTKCQNLQWFWMICRRCCCCFLCKSMHVVLHLSAYQDFAHDPKFDVGRSQLLQQLSLLSTLSPSLSGWIFAIWKTRYLLVLCVVLKWIL